jgi:hypothetical protein
VSNQRRVHHTFGKRDTRAGLSFGSKAEARYYDELRLLVAAGELLFFHRQVPIDLGCDAAGKPVIYRVDYQLFWADGRVEYVDVKGKTTPLTREHDLKTRLVSSRYPFDIQIVRR